MAPLQSCGWLVKLGLWLLIHILSLALAAYFYDKSTSCLVIHLHALM